MFQHQTAGEFRTMMGTDVRIQRDPLAMRMREDQIKQSIYFVVEILIFFILPSNKAAFAE
jgi:NhaP-type Na+/H+ or K+/H+ antiporter